MAPPTTEDGSTPAISDSSSHTQAAAASAEMGSSSGEKPWERAWSVDEMRNQAGNWSLAADSGMLQYLQQFSQRMVSRTHEISEQVNTLMHEVKLTGVRVNNTFNDFIMLANAQFIENRVYDEEVVSEAASEEKKPESEKTKEQREAELIPRISEAMKLGMNVIDTSFETLDVGDANSDSEEDEETRYRTDPILEAKDPYIQRALPHVIGSQAFMQDDDVGLVDLPSDEEVESDHGSISESESESEDEKKEPSQPSRRTTTKAEDSDSDSETASDIFGGEDSDDEISSGKVKADSEEEESEDETQGRSTDQAPRDFQSELAAKLGGNVAPPQKTKKKKVPTATLR